ncbi:MAG: GNAT family N-acetyltransferase [Chloroflexi bacterium]|nr:GNAT family N-acetyltransferase [Chloroflexota bacterium]MCC6891415.1 GNAT family N-acetyltransferase [Anaerolineae bacterium]
MPSIFEGQLIRLRAVEPGDWDIHYQWNLDSDNGRMTDEIWFPTSRATVQSWAERESVRGAEEDGTYRFQIETLSGKLVGTINTHTCSLRNGTFGYGLAILPDHQRKGYATEAIGLVLRYYFAERRYQKVNAEVYSFNQPSIALHERLGFILEGRLRRMVYSGGEYHDRLNFGITSEEFTAASWNPDRR